MELVETASRVSVTWQKGLVLEPHQTAGTPILHVGFKTATLQNTICTRIRRSNLVSGLLRASNGSNTRQNAYMSFLKCDVLQSRVGLAGYRTQPVGPTQTQLRWL